jgi:hypothetical protein
MRYMKRMDKPIYKIAWPLTCELTPPVKQTVSVITFYVNPVHRKGDAKPTRHICWCTRKEEGPFAQFFAARGQLFEVKHLTQWHTPKCQNVFVEVIC